MYAITFNVADSSGRRTTTLRDPSKCTFVVKDDNLWWKYGKFKVTVKLGEFWVHSDFKCLIFVFMFIFWFLQSGQTCMNHQSPLFKYICDLFETLSSARVLIFFKTHRFPDQRKDNWNKETTIGPTRKNMIEILIIILIYLEISPDLMVAYADNTHFQSTFWYTRKNGY